MINLNWRILSLEKSRFNVYKLQTRIFKSILVGDVLKSFSIQKLLLFSHSARIISIQSSFSTSSSLQTKLNLSFNDKVILNSLLSKNLFSWSPSFSFSSTSVFSFSDICWQNLVILALAPAHEGTLNPLNFGFRSSSSIYLIQRVVLLKLSDFYLSFNTKILRVKFFFPKQRNKLIVRFILSKLFLPRPIKISFFRYFALGFLFDTCNKLVFSWNNLQTFLINLFFDNLGFTVDYIQFGPIFFFFTNKSNNDLSLIKKLDLQIVSKLCLTIEKEVNILFPLEGFCFIDWYLKVIFDGSIFLVPSFSNYSSFLKRVKNIINNSNYLIHSVKFL